MFTVKIRCQPTEQQMPGLQSAAEKDMLLAEGTLRLRGAALFSTGDRLDLVVVS